MDSKLLALLEKSRLFRSVTSDFLVKVEVNSPEKFRFFLCNCFFFENESKSSQVQVFERVLKNFIKRYLKAWTELAKSGDSKKTFNWEEYSSSLADFFSDFDADKLFDQVVSGKNIGAIPIGPNNSQLLFYRMGNILAFDVSHMSSNEKEHLTGLRAIEALCRSEDSHNNQGVYELVHNIQASFSLPHEKNKNGSGEGDVDFGVLNDMLKTALPYVAWDFNPDAVVDAYKEVNSEGALVGKYFDLCIYAHLVHDKTNGKIDIIDKDFSCQSRAKIWRQGNTKKLGGSKYRFKECENLSLVLSLKSSLPYHATWDKVDTSFKAHREQFILANAGAIFSTQLCAMMLNAYQESSVKLGN